VLSWFKIRILQAISYKINVKIIKAKKANIKKITATFFKVINIFFY